jgi:hypothetical protein
METHFKFTHPDPDKLWRLLKRWQNGFSWGKEDLQEFFLLTREWLMCYSYMGELGQVKKLLKKRNFILKQIRENKCQIKTTTQGAVRYASKKSKPPLETCI